MDYFAFETDSKGYIHSIDNLVIAYDFKSTTYNTLKKLIPAIKELAEKYNTQYYDKLDINACRKYYFAKDFIHLDDGITLFLGCQIEKLDNPLKEQEKWLTLPVVKLEVNPNKHADKPVLVELLKLFKKYGCYDARIIRYDYAVDIPKVLDDVQVFGSNKEKGLYKGTKYFGQRNKNGFTRIYDKAKEQGLDKPLTRVETVISLTKTTKKISFEKVYIRENKNADDLKLTKTDKALIELCGLLETNGIDYSTALDCLDGRKKRFILECLGKSQYDVLNYDNAIREKLLKYMMRFFDVDKFPDPEYEFHDAGCDLPFD